MAKSNYKQKAMWGILFAGALAILMLSRWILAAQPALNQPSQPSSGTGVWEYRILTSALSDAQGFNQGPTTWLHKGKPVIHPAPPPSLEEKIKDLTDQGFEVDSFQALSAINADGTSSVRSEPTLVVLLQRLAFERIDKHIKCLHPCNVLLNNSSHSSANRCKET